MRQQQTALVFNKLELISIFQGVVPCNVIVNSPWSIKLFLAKGKLGAHIKLFNVVVPYKAETMSLSVELISKTFH